MHRFAALTLAFLLIAACAGFAWAIDFNPAASLSAITSAYEAREISVDQAALYLAYLVVDSSRLPKAYYVTGYDFAKMSGLPSGYYFSATGVLLRLNELKKECSPAVRAQIEKLLLPGERVGAVQAPADTLTSNPQGVSLPNNYYTEHFAIRWGDDYNANMDQIESWGEVLEVEVWQTEIVDWNFTPIYLSDEYFIDCYIGNSGSGAPGIGDGAGAYTTIYEDNYQPLMVFQPSAVSYTDTIRDYSSHEFFHAIQFTQGLVGGSSYIFDQGSLWFVEATAVWAESVVYPNINNYLYYFYDWATNPEEPLTSYGGISVYARGIWARYLYEYAGGVEAIHNIWTHSRGSSALYGNAGYLASIDRDWEETFFDFAVKVIDRDFEDGAMYPSFGSYRTVATYPYRNDAVAENAQPHINSLHKIQVKPGSVTDPRLNIGFLGDDITVDDTTWGLAVAKQPASGATELEILELDGKKVGEFTVQGLGTDYEKMFILITPISPRKNNYSAHYSYALQITRGDDPFEPWDTDDDDDDAADDDDDDTIADDDDDDNDAAGDDDFGGDDDTAGNEPSDDDDDDDDSCGC